MGRPPKSNLPVEFAELLHQIGANIAFARKEQEISQAELARRAKISVTTLNEIETRQFRDIRLSTLSLIAKALALPVARLLDRSDIELSSRDQVQLLKASEAILRITRKLR